MLTNPFGREDSAPPTVQGMKLPESAPTRPQTVIGLMSGTSLDGLDIATSRFARTAGGGLDAELVAFRTEPFPPDLHARLEALYEADAREWVACAAAFSTWCGEAIAGMSADLVGFHGQTVFHAPHLGYTGQLASGAHLHAACGLPVVCDFRSLDVALGGQGAPLVPLADAWLYPEAEAAVNLGGIANISTAEGAYDIVPCNLLLNRLAEREGERYDRGGMRAARGQQVPALLAELAALPYLQRSAPKSLGREEVDGVWWPVIEAHAHEPTDDLLATVTQHIADEVRSAVQGRRALVTGGGAWNATLMAGLDEVLPASRELIDGKEAHAFALLAWLRVHGVPNTWGRVTGAKRDAVGGAVYGFGL